MELKQINEIEAKKLKLIGTAMGVDMHHCIFQAKKHTPDFDKKAGYYLIKLGIQDKNKRKKFITNSNSVLVVNFYEKGGEKE